MVESPQDGVTAEESDVTTESKDEMSTEEPQTCKWCARLQSEEGAPFQPGEFVLCGRQHEDVLGGLPAFNKEKAQVMSVWKQGTSRRAYMVHLQFTDGHCQTTKSRFIEQLHE